MRLVLIKIYDDKSKEIVIEDSFLWFKWRVAYFKIDGVIMRFKKGKYYHVGWAEEMTISSYFDINSNEFLG